MNAGRGIEQLIGDWLVEEAAPGAPDRVLASTRQVIHRTSQRRYAAIWRESMFTPARLAAMAAMLALAVGAGAWIGRATAPIGPAAPAATSVPASTAPAVTLAAYRAARNAICNRYAVLADPLKVVIADGRIFDPTVSTAERAPSVEALTQLLTMFRTMTDELRALPVPSDVRAEHSVAVERSADIDGLIAQQLLAVGEGKWQGAEALDTATDPLSRHIEAFETRYQLAACP